MILIISKTIITKKIKSQAPNNQQPQLLTVDVILFWKIVVVGSTIQGFMVIYSVSLYFVWRNETTFHFSSAINTYISPRTNVHSRDGLFLGVFRYIFCRKNQIVYIVFFIFVSFLLVNFFFILSLLLQFSGHFEYYFFFLSFISPLAYSSFNLLVKYCLTVKMFNAKAKIKLYVLSSVPY